MLDSSARSRPHNRCWDGKTRWGGGRCIVCNGLGTGEGGHGIPHKGAGCSGKPHQSHLTGFATSMGRGQGLWCTAESGIVIRLHVALEKQTLVQQHFGLGTPEGYTHLALLPAKKETFL